MDRIKEDYFRQKVESATPLERVVMLYEGALRLLDMSRENLRRGEVESFTLTNIRAQNILNELRTSLDHAKGGEVSGRLDALYTYLIRRLVDANRKQDDEGIAHVATLLEDLRGAWAQAASQEKKQERQEVS